MTDQAAAGALRRAMAEGNLVEVVLSDADLGAVEGMCSYVSPSDAYAIVGDYHVPLAYVIRVHQWRPTTEGGS